MQELAAMGDHIYSHTSFTMEQGCKSWQQWETTSIVMPALPWNRDLAQLARVTSGTGMQELATVGDHIYSNASFTMEQGCGIPHL